MFSAFYARCVVEASINIAIMLPTTDLNKAYLHSPASLASVIDYHNDRGGAHICISTFRGKVKLIKRVSLTEKVIFSMGCMLTGEP